MNDSDELLDRITTDLRNDSVPEMPAGWEERLQIPSTVESVTRQKSGVWLLLGTCAVIVALACGVAWLVKVPRTQPQVEEPLAQQEEKAIPKVEDGIEIVAADLAEPINELAKKLDSLDAQIDSLKNLAAITDAKNLADELLTEQEFTHID